MPDRKRAAQFMPFNGLRGYAEQVTAPRSGEPPEERSPKTAPAP